MKRIRLVALAMLAIPLIDAQAQTPRYLEDLLDARASSGEGALEDRGYRHQRTVKSRDSSVAYWWSERERECVAVTTRNGRYASIVEQSESMCGNGRGQPASSGGSPFSYGEAQEIAAVWGTIREAGRFEDINWRSVGLREAPGSYQARELMSQHWGELRQARRFDDIDWASVTGYRGESDRHADSGRYGGPGPFTYGEAGELSAVWGSIRQAARFEDINWQSVGLREAPGSYQARELMSQHWGRLRQAGRFEDIDWEAATGYRGGSSRQPDRGWEAGAGPFTRSEAEDLSAAWGRIRQAARFEDINWRSVGLSAAPGSYEARSLMSRNWGRLRQASRFESINWDSIR